MKRTLVALQGFRFCAFLLIFANHTYWVVEKIPFFWFGTRGVEIFFVLSGFLMAYNYRNDALGYDLKSSVEYMLKKLKKFYGLHILFFFIMLVKITGHLYKHGMDYRDGWYGFFRDAVLNITLLQGWYDPAKFSFNGVAWFLSDIVFIYLCVPFIIHFFKNRGGTRWFLFLVLLKASCDWYHYHTGFNPVPGIFSYYANPAYRLQDFLIGYTGYLMCRNWKLELGNLSVSLLQVGILSVYLVCCRVFDKIWEPIPFILLAFLLIYICTLPHGIFDYILGNRLLVHLGNISFELYIVHQVLISLFTNPISKVIGSHSWFVIVILLFLSIGAAEFFHWKPIKHFFTKTIYGEA